MREEVVQVAAAGLKWSRELDNIMCLLVGYQHWALALCWASGGVDAETKSRVSPVQRQKGTQ